MCNFAPSNKEGKYTLTRVIFCLKKGSTSPNEVADDVYVAGFDNNAQGYYVATLWKNGQAQNLTDGTYLNGFAKSVYVSGEDVYVAGYENPRKDETNPITYNSIAKLWKNGAFENLRSVYYSIRKPNQKSSKSLKIINLCIKIV